MSMNCAFVPVFGFFRRIKRPSLLSFTSFHCRVAEKSNCCFDSESNSPIRAEPKKAIVQIHQRADFSSVVRFERWVLYLINFRIERVAALLFVGLAVCGAKDLRFLAPLIKMLIHLSSRQAGDWMPFNRWQNLIPLRYVATVAGAKFLLVSAQTVKPRIDSWLRGQVSPNPSSLL